LVAQVSVEHQDIHDKLQEGGVSWVKQLADELRPLKRKGSEIIGLGSGNHYMDFTFKTKDCTEKIHSDAYLAGLLGIPYLGTMNHMAITLADEKSGKRATVKIIMHHGAGGAQTVGGSLNRVQRMLNGWNASIGLMGDDHQRAVIPIGSILDTDDIGGRPTVLFQVRWAARTGSFMRGFEINQSSYVVDRCFNPTSIGTVEFELMLRKNNQTGGVHVAIGAYQSP
jgi:hypothetical protein